MASAPWEKYQSKPWEKYQAPQRPGVPENVELSASEIVSNIPSSAYNYASDFVGAITSPIETGKAIYDVGEGVIDKFSDDPGEVDKSAIADAVWQMMVDRYGSEDAIKNTINTDPVGVFGDVIGVLSMGAGNLGKLEPIAATANAVNKAGRLIPESVPRGMYKEAAKFNRKKGVNPDDLADTAVTNRIMPTQAGLNKSQAMIDDLSAQVDDIIEAGVGSGERVPLGRIVAGLEQLEDKYKGPLATGPESLAYIQRQKRALIDHFGELESVNPKELLDFRRDADRRANYAKDRGDPQPIVDQYYKKLAGTAREELGEVVPEIKDVNAKLGPMIELQDNLKAPAQRIDRRNAVSFGQQTGTTGGAVIGQTMGIPEIGATLGFALSSLEKPKLKARMAFAIESVRNGDTRPLRALTNAQANFALRAAEATDDELKAYGLLPTQ